MLVFDTGCFINGWRDHYPPSTFPSVWTLLGAAIADGRIVVPREVYRELMKKDDDVSAWARGHNGSVVEPSAEVQRHAGLILARLPNPGVRDGADPFVVAEGLVRGFTVVTYEGRSFSGVPTKNWASKMPGICGEFGVPCRTLPEALGMLGASF